MKEKITLCTLLLLFAYSCKKDHTEIATSKENIPLIVTKSLSTPSSATNDSTYYFYDNEGRSKGYSHRQERFDITFNSSSVIIKAFFDNEPNYTLTYTLNEQKKVSIMDYTGPFEPANGNYFYNNKNQLVKWIDRHYGKVYTTFYFYEGDNLIKSVFEREENSTLISDTTTYEYYQDKVSTIEPVNCGMPFKELQSKYLKKKERTKLYTVEYTYEFDLQNRVINEIAKINGEVASYTSYKYKD